MPKEKRDNPFVWPSWISKLVAGEDQCLWKYWFKSHFMYDKAPSDFNLAIWTAKHTALVRERCTALKRLGYKVFIEDQNSFKLNLRLPIGVPLKIPKDSLEYTSPLMQTITISGKADIIAIGQEEDEKITGVMHDVLVVEDAKTGKCKNSDHIQVMLYMMWLPLGIPEYKEKKFSGTVVYKLGVKNAEIPIEAAQDESLKKIIWDTIKQITGDEADCQKVPSKKECDWCDISCSDCDERIE